MKQFLVGVGLVLVCASWAYGVMTTRFQLIYGVPTLVSGSGVQGPVMLEAVWGDAWCAFDGVNQHAHAGFLLKRGSPFVVPAEYTTTGIWCTPDRNTYTELRVVP